MAHGLTRRVLFFPILAIPFLQKANCFFHRQSRSPLPATAALASNAKVFVPINPNKEDNIAMMKQEQQYYVSESRKAFIEWAVRHAIPIDCIEPTVRPKDDDDDDNNDDNGQIITSDDPFLSYLANAASSASVVLLSEGYHNCKEMMKLHHRIIQHLTVNCDFSLVATESGMPESRDVADYVTATKEYPVKEKDMLWTKGLNKMYSAWAEGRELIEWMRTINSINSNSSNNKVEYCGLDIGGFYSDWDYPISKIQTYLKDKFPEFEEEWSSKIRPILAIMGNEQARYNHQHLLTPGQKSTLVLLLDDLVMKLNSCRDDELELEGDIEYEWARQSSVSMQLAENYYRNYENMVQSDSGGTVVSKYTGLDGREIAMANNAYWRLNLNLACSSEDRQVSDDNARQKKMVIINHVIHTKTATQYQDGVWGHFVPMGQLLKQMLTSSDDRSEDKCERMFGICMLYGSGTFWNKWQKPGERFTDSSPPPKEDGLEATMKQISEEANMLNFFLHWESAPREAWAYLNEVTTIRENDYFVRAYPLEWNGCIYLDEVSHATPA